MAICIGALFLAMSVVSRIPLAACAEEAQLELGDRGKGSETGALDSVPYAQAGVESEQLPLDQRRYGLAVARKYQPGGKLEVVPANDGILTAQTDEKPGGQWNEIELVGVAHFASVV